MLQTWGIVFGSKQSTTHVLLEAARKLNFKKIPFTQSPLEIFSKLYKRYETAYILESIEGPRKLAQYSFIGFDPRLTIKTKNGETTIHNEKTGEENREKTSDPLRVLENLVKDNALSNKEFRFVGGAVGYISYDAVRYWEKLPTRANDDLNFPDAQLGIFDDGIVFDHKQKRAFYYYSNENRLSEVERLIKQPSGFEPLSYTQPKVNITKEHFKKAVEKAKEYVASGDVFQVVLSKRYEFRVKGDLIAFYRSLRRINPSPYMYFLKIGDKQIVGSSPEMLVRVDNRVIETFPIAGTRPCVEDPSENRRLAKELLAVPKERAEHVMLVDLAKVDVGKISKFGSVHVPEFMKVHRYSHVQHIVSQVVGDLKEDRECYDALRAVFPAGTVSGAPKVRAMEIIEELEPSRRGPYAGAVGYFSYNGNADFAITIRTLFADKDKAYIQAGAGIVADSSPEREWFETDHKAEALMKALEKFWRRNILKVLVIDNYDSFVYNLVQYIGELGGETAVYRNDQVDLRRLMTLKPDRIVISPGPGTPEEVRYFGVCTAVLQSMSREVPTLGVCLGHQGIIHAFGGKIVHAKRLMHGKTCAIRHDGKGIFRGVHNPFTATRYHSLAGDKRFIPSCLEITAESIDDGEIMGVRHTEYPIEGVQFHPESILCEDGKLMVKNFLERDDGR